MFWSLLLAIPLAYWMIEFAAGARPDWTARRLATLKVAAAVWGMALVLLLPFVVIGQWQGPAFVVGVPAALLSIVCLGLYYPAYALLSTRDHRWDNGLGLTPAA
jgi:hypothetical protein